jgi:hypothetical protein
MLVHDVLEVDDDRADEPLEDDVVHSPSAGKSGGFDIGGDMVVKSIALQRQQDEAAPTGVVFGDVEDDEDHGLDVLDTGGLGMDAGDGEGEGLERVVDPREEGCLCWGCEVLLDGGELTLVGGSRSWCNMSAILCARSQAATIALTTAGTTAKSVRVAATEVLTAPVAVTTALTVAMVVSSR